MCVCNGKQEADLVRPVCSDTCDGTLWNRWPIKNRSSLPTVLDLGESEIKVPDLNCFLDPRV